MSLIWELSETLKRHGISNASQLQRELEIRLGIYISRQSLHRFITHRPDYVKMETLQIICNLLQVSSHEFMLINPEQTIRTDSDIIKPYKKQALSDLLLSDPLDFL